MCDCPHYFRGPRGFGVAMLPFALDLLIADWESVRAPLLRHRPEAFRRSEWAFLMTALEPERLWSHFTEAFGCPVDKPSGPVTRLLRPRGTVAVWLPNNVSLLGPLITVALSLTENRILLKSGSKATDLAGTFLQEVLGHLQPGPLRTILERHVCHEIFDRNDPRNRKWAQQADVRIVFGSDEATVEVHAHAPANGVSISFSDRQSVAWIEPGADTDEVLENLIRVFAIYGAAGCTSPRKVVLLNSTPAEAQTLRNRLLALWPRVIRERPPMHLASANYLTWQLALARGWDAILAPANHAVIATGGVGSPAVDGPMFLPVVASTVEQAVALLPSNIQTLGHALLNPNDTSWLTLLAGAGIKRLVPIAHMHHFGDVWDGRNFWRDCFEEVEVRL